MASRKARTAILLESCFVRFSVVRKENLLGRVMVELAVVLAASRGNAPQVFREAAQIYKVDTDIITLKVRQDFAAKDKARTQKKLAAKKSTSTLRKTA
jgi:ParB family chromosome partitioning protein